MIRTMLLTAAATLALAASAVTASAAPMSTAPGLGIAGTSVIAVGGHKVCLKHQCPGRSRIVCGCPAGTR